MRLQTQKEKKSLIRNVLHNSYWRYKKEHFTLRTNGLLDINENDNADTLRSKEFNNELKEVKEDDLVEIHNGKRRSHDIEPIRNRSPESESHVIVKIRGNRASFQHRVLKKRAETNLKRSL